MDTGPFTKYWLGAEFTTGEYVERIKIDYLKQGSVTYVIKMLVFNDTNKDEYKKLLNTKLAENSKVEQIIKLSKYNNYIKDIEIIDNELILKYEYYISKETLYDDNLALFTLVDDLDKITCNFEHKKTKKVVYEGEMEIEQETITREEINSVCKITTENYAEFIKNY